MPPVTALFSHSSYELVDDKFIRNPEVPYLRNEEEELLKEISSYLESKIIIEYDFISIQIPYDDSTTEISTRYVYVFTFALTNFTSSMYRYLTNEYLYIYT